MLAGAERPGSPSIARKTKTPARASMMISAAVRAIPAKSRSPRRTTGFRVGSVGAVSVTRTPSARRDRADDALCLRGQLRLERGGPGLLRRGLLTGVGEDVGQEAVDEGGLVGVVVVLAGQQVRREQHRVGAGLGRGPVDV